MLPLFATKLASRGTPTKKRAHVAVCPFVVPPHPEIFFLLSRKIAAENRDVEVTMFTSSFYAMYLYWYWNPEEDKNLHFYPVGPFTSSSHKPTSEAIIQAYLKDFGNSVARAEEEIGEKITYVVADALFADACRQVAEERGAKWSAVWNSSAALLAATIHSEQIRTQSGISIPVIPGSAPQPDWDKAQPVDHYLPGFPTGVPFFSLPHHIRFRPDSLENHNVFPNLLHHMTLSLPKAEAVLINSFHHLESDVTSALLPNTFNLGGPFSLALPFPPKLEPLNNDHSVFSWLDTRLSTPNSVLYIKLAESDTFPFSHEFSVLAVALEATGVSFLWFIPPEHWSQVELPAGFVQRTSETGQGMVVSGQSSALSPMILQHWEMKVLSHKAVGAQLRQSSWTTVIQTIAVGVPIICKPSFEFDQQFNVTLVQSVWGIGIELDQLGFQRDTIEKLLKKVMIEDEGRKMWEKIVVLKKNAEKDIAIPNGSSFLSLNKFINLVTR